MNNYKGEERRQHMDWHLNKNFALSIILLLITQTVSGIWWAASITSEVDRLKSKPDLIERVIKLEAKADEQGRVLSRIDETLNRLDETINKVAAEQQRRSTTIERTEDFLKGRK